MSVTATQPQPNWKALLAADTSENEVHGTRKRVCENCGLPLGSSVPLKVPGITGSFCSILCVECRLFGPGRCRWCGTKADNRFCGDACRKRSEKVPFGNGVRLLAYLEANLPALYAKVMAAPAGCKRCKGSMEGKRADAVFCGDACKQADYRNGGES